MPPIGRAEFAARLAELDTEGLAGFVAALYRARGERVAPVEERATGRDRLLVVGGADDRDGPGHRDAAGDDPPTSERVVCVRGSAPRFGQPPSVPADCDVVVAPDPAAVPDAAPVERALGADALRELTLYGVDRAVAADLCRDHLGVDVERDAGPLHPEPPATGGDAERGDGRRERSGSAKATDAADGAGGTGGAGGSEADERPGRTVVLALVLAVALLAGGTIVGGAIDGDDPGVSAAIGRLLDDPGGAGSGGEPSGDGATVVPTGDGEPNDDGATDAVVDRSTTRDAASTIGGDDGPGGSGELDGGDETGADDEPVAGADFTRTSYAQILQPDGSIAEGTLAEAHAESLANRSYTLTISHWRVVDGRPVGVEREVVRVAEATRFVSRVERYGVPVEHSLVVAERERFANGTRRVTRVGDGSYVVDPEPIGRVDADPHADRVSTYIEWFLSVESSEITDVDRRERRSYYWLSTTGDSYPGVENATGMALVDDRGRVHELRRTYDLPNDPGVSAVVTIRYTDVGETTVTPPAWYRNGTRVENDGHTSPTGGTSPTTDGGG